MNKTATEKKFQVSLIWLDEGTEFQVEVSSDCVENAIDKAMLVADPDAQVMFEGRELELRGAKEI